MSLNPSNLIAARTNPERTTFQNLAVGPDAMQIHKDWVDETVQKELKAAGIPAAGPHEFLRDGREVPAAYMGELCLWGFRRAWYYWVAKGPGVPPDRAEEFHQTWGTQVRVAGHCGCPSPLEWGRGFAISEYHVDTQEGLNAFAALLRSIYVPSPEETVQCKP